MDHNNRHYVGYWRNLVFFKRTMNQLDCTVQQLQKIERDSVTKADLEGNHRRIKKTSIRSVRIIHPRRLTVRILMGARKEIKEIRQNYLTKDDFIREINKVDRKVEQMLNMMIEMTRNGGSQ